MFIGISYESFLMISQNTMILMTNLVTKSKIVRNNGTYYWRIKKTVQNFITLNQFKIHLHKKILVIRSCTKKDIS